MMSHTGDILNAPLSILGLNIRATNALVNNGCSTVGDLLAKTEIEISKLQHLGPTTLTDIKAKLSARGLTLRPGPPVPKRK